MSCVLRSLCLFTALGALWLPSGALAASSGQFTISGTVALVNSLAVTPNGSNNVSLSITGGESGKNVASVAETSNDANGYTVSLSSASGGWLELAGHASVRTSYRVSYGGGDYAQPTSAGAVVKSVSSLPGLTTSNSAVLVNVTAYPGAPAGTYSDTITLSIIAN